MATTNTDKAVKLTRRDEFLQKLVELLETNPQERISTAILARACGVSEAALYRQFSNKAEMYDQLLNFIDDSLLGVLKTIRESTTHDSVAKILAMMNVLLEYVEVNKGLARILTGHALTGEDPRLLERLRQIHTKIENMLKQAYKDAILERRFPADFNAAGRAELVYGFIVGRWLHFVMSNFITRAAGISPLVLAPFTLP